jgi:hypothetical protein
VQIDALAVRLRPRNQMEASDLGVGLCQSAAFSVYPCYAIAAIPIAAIALCTGEIAKWLPTLVIWCAKPWLDRTILFVLSRAAFGQPTRPSDVWREQRRVWWKQLVFTWTVRRLSPWRSLTGPVYELEDLSIWNARPRVRQIRRGNVGSALMMTTAFSLAETALTLALLSLVFWLAPRGMTPQVGDLLAGDMPGFLSAAMFMSYAITVMFLEPFYVAAGFALYLNRRADLEAWDIEQELRHVFAD